MSFPLGFWDLSLWLAITAITLLITSELLSPKYGKTRICINTKRLKTTALTVSTLFLITVIIRVIILLISS